MVVAVRRAGPGASGCAEGWGEEDGKYKGLGFYLFILYRTVFWEELAF
jgi:hypothetical protein